MHLLSLRDPHDHYNLTKDKPIVIMNMGISATQAREVVFESIKNFIVKSPFFNQFKPTVQNESIRFKKENLLVFSGNSKSTTPLGYNVFSAILDEASFYLDNDKSVAKDIYE
jgi:hypothetical protein